jgi:hypothetical protein
MHIIRTLAVFGLLVSIVACSEEGENDEQTNFRFFNAVPDLESVDFLVDADSVFPGTGFLEGSGYIETDTDIHNYLAVATGSFATLGARSTRLQDDVDYTFMLIGRANEARLLFVPDNNEPASDDSVKIRAIHAATAVRSLDVYVSNTRDGLAATTPTFDNVGFGSVSGYLVGSDGLYDITVTESFSREVLARLRGQSLEAKNVYTLVVADTKPGRRPLQIVVLQDTAKD